MNTKSISRNGTPQILSKMHVPIAFFFKSGFQEIKFYKINFHFSNLSGYELKALTAFRTKFPPKFHFMGVVWRYKKS